MCIPAPTDNDTPFVIKDVLTIYEAAMVYAGRHPYPHFFDVKGRGIEEHLKFLRLGVSETSPKKRPRAQRSWDIYCELIKRIEQGRIQPIKPSYDRFKRVDLCRTQIRIADLVDLAKERGEKLKYLRHLMVELPVAAESAAQTKSIASPTKLAPAQIDAEYKQRIDSFLREQKRYPNRQEDAEWEKTRS